MLSVLSFFLVTKWNRVSCWTTWSTSPVSSARKLASPCPLSRPLAPSRWRSVACSSSPASPSSPSSRCPPSRPAKESTPSPRSHVSSRPSPHAKSSRLASPSTRSSNLTMNTVCFQIPFFCRIVFPMFLLLQNGTGTSRTPSKSWQVWILLSCTITFPAHQHWWNAMSGVAHRLVFQCRLETAHWILRSLLIAVLSSSHCCRCIWLVVLVRSVVDRFVEVEICCVVFCHACSTLLFLSHAIDAFWNVSIRSIR